MTMIDTEWFRIKPDPDAPAVEVECFDAKKYPYFTDAESFAALDHSVVHYERDKFSPCDILFQPTFLIGDRLLELFKLLEPSMEFKGVQMYRKFNPSDAPCPLFWLPYLPPVEIKFTHRAVVQDELSFVSQKRGANRENHNIYCDSSDLHLGEGKFNQTQVVQEKAIESCENGNIYYRSFDPRSENGNIYYRIFDHRSENGNIYYRIFDLRSENGNIYYRIFDSQPENEKFTHRAVVQDELSFMSKKMGANRENHNIYRDSSDLHLGDEKFTHRAVVQDKLSFMSKKLPALRGRRVVHFRLPDEDIWLLSLEAAECLLRRQPVGIVLEKIFIQP